jgi:hypothetical protein
MQQQSMPQARLAAADKITGAASTTVLRKQCFTLAVQHWGSWALAAAAARTALEAANLVLQGPIAHEAAGALGLYSTSYIHRSVQHVLRLSNSSARPSGLG